jgi:hypothetical protein
VHCITSFILWREEYPAKRGATTAAGITVHSFVIRYQFARYKVSGTGAAERRYDSLVYVFNYENVCNVGSYETDALGSGGNLVGYG